MCSGVPFWCRELSYFPSQKLHAARAIKLMAKKERDDVDTGRRREKGLLVGVASVLCEPVLRSTLALRTANLRGQSERFLPTTEQQAEVTAPTNCHRQRNNQHANSHNPIAVACFLPNGDRPTANANANSHNRPSPFFASAHALRHYHIQRTCIKSSHERR